MDAISLSTYSFYPTTPTREQSTLQRDGKTAEKNTALVAEHDSVELSDAAKKLIEKSHKTSEKRSTKSAKEIEAEKEKIEKLKKRDEQVKAHEAAHKSNGGSYAGAIVYTYAIGPDGKEYATDGYVNFNMSPESSPSQTVAKANAIYRAAMAPSDPSAADIEVAQQAKEMRAKALEQEKAEQKQ